MQVSQSTGISGLTPAEVLEWGPDRQFLRVKFVDAEMKYGVWARWALGHTAAANVGDQVLIAGDATDELYVIGCLGAARTERVESPSGVYAERGLNPAGEETIQVRSASDELLFEADPSRGITRLMLPQGQLELITGDGDLVLRSAGSVRLEGESVTLQGRRQVSMSVVRTATAALSWVRLLPERLQAGGPNLEISARRGDMQIAHGVVQGEEFTIEAEKCRVSAGTLETVAETIVERAGNVYRFVRALAQQQVGRWRTYVKGIAHFRSKRGYFSSEETLHIDGEKVHIG